MRVAVVNWTNGGFSAGYRKYLQRLMPLLRDHPAVSEFHVFLPPHAADLAERIGASTRTWPRTGMRSARRWLRVEISRARVEVVFIPTARWLEFAPAATVVMVRNMEPLVAAWDGNSWIDRLKNVARQREARIACYRASRVLAVSDYVRGFLVGTWKVPVDRVGVVYHGVENPIPPPRSIQPRQLSGLTNGDFVLVVGSIRPARGLDDLLRAWPLVRQQVPGLRLMVAGKADPGTGGYFRKLRRLAEDLDIVNELILAGHLPEAEMAWCFQNAAAFVVTSRAEACPNTVLEAMNYGALCVSTDTPPMPEFFRDSARYYKQGSPSALAEALVAVLNAAVSEKRSLRLASLSRARDFCWRRTAERTVEELSRALGVASGES